MSGNQPWAKKIKKEIAQQSNLANTKYAALAHLANKQAKLQMQLSILLSKNNPYRVYSNLVVKPLLQVIAEEKRVSARQAIIGLSEALASEKKEDLTGYIGEKRFALLEQGVNDIHFAEKLDEKADLFRQLRADILATGRGSSAMVSAIQKDRAMNTQEKRANINITIAENESDRKKLEEVLTSDQFQRNLGDVVQYLQLYGVESRNQVYEDGQISDVEKGTASFAGDEGKITGLMKPIPMASHQYFLTFTLILSHHGLYHLKEI